MRGRDRAQGSPVFLDIDGWPPGTKHVEVTLHLHQREPAIADARPGDPRTVVTAQPWRTDQIEIGLTPLHQPIRQYERVEMVEKDVLVGAESRVELLAHDQAAVRSQAAEVARRK